MGRLYIGKNVDMVIFKKELSGFDWTNICIWVDLGFIGIEKTLSNMKEEDKRISIGHKKKKKGKLTDVQKVENFEIARVRIKVEHAIGGIKRYYILRNEIRVKKPHINIVFDLAAECCTGLWNYRRTFKNSFIS